MMRIAPLCMLNPVDGRADIFRQPRSWFAAQELRRPDRTSGPAWHIARDLVQLRSVLSGQMIWRLNPR